MTQPIPRTAKPGRPAFHDQPAIDRLLAISLALASEVSVLKDRLDTLELLGAQAGWLAPGAVDGFIPDHATRLRRETAREAYLGRVLHILKAEVESLEDGSDYWATIAEVEGR